MSNKNVVFYHIRRRENPHLKGHIMAPALYQAPTTSRKFRQMPDGPVQDGVTTYSDPRLVGHRQQQVGGAIVSVEVDRTAITFNNRGELFVPASNKKLVQFMRNHELCQGSLANQVTQARPKFYEYNPEQAFENEMLAIENLASVVTHIKGLNKEQLVNYARQFNLPIVRPENMDLKRLQQALLIQAKMSPERFMVPETITYGEVITDIKKWQKSKVITFFGGGRGKTPEWRWNTLYQPEGADRVILEMKPGQDKYLVFAEFLANNEIVQDTIREAAGT